MAIIRKQIYDLTLADLADFPVWEFALDEEGAEGQDERTVRPRAVAEPIERGDYVVVKATFELADGTLMGGFLTPPAPDDNSIGQVQPVVLLEHGAVGFYHGIFHPEPDALAAIYKLLGKRSDEVFPCRFRSSVTIRGGDVEGNLDGFYYLEPDRTRRVRDWSVKAVR